METWRGGDLETGRLIDRLLQVDFDRLNHKELILIPDTPYLSYS